MPNEEIESATQDKERVKAPRPKKTPKQLLPTYQRTETGMIWNRPAREESFNPVSLSNFSAEIHSQITETDGEQEEIRFELTAKVNGLTQHVVLSASEFESPDWTTRRLGASAIRYPGHGMNDHLRVAIQTCSPNIREKRVYLHTGWTVIEGRAYFVHAGGFLGPAGAMGPIFEMNNKIHQARVHPSLAAFHLPSPPTGDELKLAIKASLDITLLAPPHISFPFLASIYRPPLGPCDYSVFASGASGALKTSLAAIGQQHYGPDLHAENLPANWDSTANANLAIAHLAKDVLLVVDDWVLRGSRGEMDRTQRDADRLIRSQANHAGRARATPQGLPRQGASPRCLLFGTGEATPDGHSLNSRMLLLEIQPGDINKRVLTILQSKARNGVLAQVMSAYVVWLASDLDAKREEMVERRNEFRANILADCDHARTATMVADVLAGFEVFLDFALEERAIDQADYDRLYDQMNKVLFQYISNSNQSLKLASPTERFMCLLRTALLTGKAHVRDQLGGAPTEDPEAWGWRTIERLVASNNDDPDQEEVGKLITTKTPRGSSIGYVGGYYLYLDIVATLNVIQPLAREAGHPLPFTDRTLGRALHDAGLLQMREQKRGKYTTRHFFEGRRSSFLVLLAISLCEPADPVDQDQFEGLLA